MHVSQAATIDTAHDILHTTGGKPDA